MNSKFIVLITGRFEREFKKVAAAHQDLSDRYSQVIGILGADPYNNRRQHPIKKLEAVAEGQGQ